MVLDQNPAHLCRDMLAYHIEITFCDLETFLNFNLFSSKRFDADGSLGCCGDV